LNFELEHALRRLKPQRSVAGLKRRPNEALRFVPAEPSPGPELLLDTCVYIDVLQHRASEAVKGVLARRLCNHSGIALAELTHLFGRLNPRDSRTTNVLSKIESIILAIPVHRLRAPSAGVLGEAGILAGMTARFLEIATTRVQALLNDAILYLQAIEDGHTVLTRNIREFDCFDQLFPSDRVLFYERDQ
jgi:predicted nucleic acid-binding protein